MQGMLKLPLELIFPKTCSAAKSTAEERCLHSSPPCFLTSSPSVFAPGIPQKPQSMVRRMCLCRSTLEGAAMSHCPPSASGCPQHSLRLSTTICTFTWCQAQPWGWARCSPLPPQPQPPDIPWQRHSTRFLWGFTHPYCSGNRELMVSAIFLETGFPQKMQPTFSSL